MVRHGRATTPRRGVRWLAPLMAAAMLAAVWLSVQAIAAPAAGTTRSATTATASLAANRSGRGGRVPCWPAGAYEQLAQSDTGAISGCLLLGPLASGSYRISLQADLTTAEAEEQKLARAGGRGSANRPQVALTLTPDAGPPGTVVTVAGRVSTAISAAGQQAFAAGYGDFAWDGIPQGLIVPGEHTAWRTDRSFSAQIAVPAAPWVEIGQSPASSARGPAGSPCRCTASQTAAGVTARQARGARSSNSRCAGLQAGA